MSKLSRRSLVAGAASLPALAAIPPVAHAASEFAIERLGEKLSAGIDRHSAVCDRLEDVEQAMWEWERRNPKPTMCEPDNADYIRAMERVSADLRAAVNSKAQKNAEHEHTEAVKAWQQRKDIAERECGYDAVHDAEGAVCEETARLVDTLAETPAGSWRALKMKAAIAAHVAEKYNGTHFGDAIASSIVDDINRLARVS